MLDRQEMEELSAWIFSAAEANNVEERIRLTLMEDSDPIENLYLAEHV